MNKAWAADAVYGDVESHLSCGEGAGAGAGGGALAVKCDRTYLNAQPVGKALVPS